MRLGNMAALMPPVERPTWVTKSILKKIHDIEMYLSKYDRAIKDHNSYYIMWNQKDQSLQNFVATLEDRLTAEGIHMTDSVIKPVALKLLEMEIGNFKLQKDLNRCERVLDEVGRILMWNLKDAEASLLYVNHIRQQEVLGKEVADKRITSLNLEVEDQRQLIKLQSKEIRGLEGEIENREQTISELTTRLRSKSTSKLHQSCETRSSEAKIIDSRDGLRAGEVDADIYETELKRNTEDSTIKDRKIEEQREVIERLKLLAREPRVHRLQARSTYQIHGNERNNEDNDGDDSNPRLDQHLIGRLTCDDSTRSKDKAGTQDPDSIIDKRSQVRPQENIEENGGDNNEDDANPPPEPEDTSKLDATNPNGSKVNTNGLVLERDRRRLEHPCLRHERQLRDLEDRNALLAADNASLLTKNESLNTESQSLGNDNASLRAMITASLVEKGGCISQDRASENRNKYDQHDSNPTSCSNTNSGTEAHTFNGIKDTTFEKAEEVTINHTSTTNCSQTKEQQPDEQNTHDKSQQKTVGVPEKFHSEPVEKGSSVSSLPAKEKKALRDYSRKNQRRKEKRAEQAKKAEEERKALEEAARVNQDQQEVSERDREGGRSGQRSSKNGGEGFDNKAVGQRPSPDALKTFVQQLLHDLPCNNTTLSQEHQIQITKFSAELPSFIPQDPVPDSELESDKRLAELLLFLYRFLSVFGYTNRRLWDIYFEIARIFLSSGFEDYFAKETPVDSRHLFNLQYGSLQRFICGNLAYHLARISSSEGGLTCLQSGVRTTSLDVFCKLGAERCSYPPLQ